MRLAVCFCLFLANAFGALVTTYTSRAAFLAASGPVDTWDFNGPDGNPVITLQSLGTSVASVSSIGGDPQGTINGNGLCGSEGGGVDCFKPVRVTLLVPALAFGYDNHDLILMEEAVVNIGFTDGTTRQYVFDLGGEDTLTPIFFGLKSNTPISYFETYSRTAGTTDVGRRANVIDDVSIASAVPEPSTFAAAVAALALGWAARRRRA